VCRVVHSRDFSRPVHRLKSGPVDSSRHNFVELEEEKQTRRTKKTKKCPRPVLHKEDQAKLVIRKPKWMNNHIQGKQATTDNCLLQPMTNDLCTAACTDVVTVTENAVMASSNAVPDIHQPSDEPNQQLSSTKFYGISARNVRKLTDKSGQ